VFIKKINKMSEKKDDKTKLFHKLHQLQKRLHRMDENPGHSNYKKKVRNKILKKLQERIKGKGRKDI